MAGPVTSEERALLAQLSERFREELALREREGRLWPCFFGETALCRILRGNAGELERTAAWFERFLEKVVEYGVDDLVGELVERLKGQDSAGTTDAVLPFFDEVHKYFRLVFEAPKCSPDGDLVQYIALVDLDKYGILEGLEWDHWVKFARASILLLCLRLEQMSCAQRRMVKCVLVVDLASCTMDSVLCSTFDHANDRDVSKMLEEIAVEIVSEVYIVNCPWSVTTLFDTFKTLIPSNLATKCKFLQGDGLNESDFVDRAGGCAQLERLYAQRAGLVIAANRTINPPHVLDGLPTEKEMQQIARLRERFAEAFSAREKAGLLHPCFFGDLAIARVLRGNDGSLSMAVRWFERFLERANLYNVDRHYQYVVQRLDEAGSQYGSLTMLPHYDEVKDYYRMVFTAPRPNPKGDVVQYIAISDVDRQGILDNVDWSHWVAFMRSYMILRCIEAERLSRLRKRMVRCISIFDLEDSGIGIKGLPSLPDFDETNHRDVFEAMQHICAEILGPNYVVNAPWVMVKAYNWFRSFVPDKLSQKLRVLDGDGQTDTAFLHDVGGEAQLRQLLRTRVGLTRSTQDEPSGMRDIPPGQDFQKSYEVSAGQRVTWSCEVLPGFAEGLLGFSSVEFGITAYWLGDDLVGGASRQHVQEILPAGTLDSRRGRVTGSCKAEGSGVMSFTWSNHGNSLRTKAVRYLVVVSGGPGEGEDGPTGPTSSPSTPPAVLRTHGGDGPQQQVFQYFRFTPTQTRRSASRSPAKPGDHCQLCALHLQSHGSPIAMGFASVSSPGGRSPAEHGPENLVDGKLSTKWVDTSNAAVVFKFPLPVHVDAISFTTAGDQPESDPVCWLLDGSHNGSTWVLLHSQAAAFPMPLARLESSVWVRPSSACTMSHCSQSSLEVVHAEPQTGRSFQAFRFVPLRLRADDAPQVQVAELKFRTTTGSIIRLDDVIVSNPGGHTEKGHGPWRAVDGNRHTFWADQQRGSLVLQFPHYMKLEEFCFTTAPDRPECDPIHWVLEGAHVGGMWTVLVCSMDEHSVPLRRSSSTVWFSLTPRRDVLLGSAAGRSSSSTDHVWVTRQQFEEHLRGLACHSWDDFRATTSASAGVAHVEERPAVLWSIVLVVHMLLVYMLALLGWQGHPAASLAVTAGYSAAMYLAMDRGWLGSCVKQAFLNGQG